MILVATTLVAALLAAPPPESADADPASRYRSIDSAITAGELDRADRLLSDADLPAGTRHRLQGRIADARGDATSAARAYAAALALSENDTPLRLHLARAQLAADRPAEALKTLDGIRSADPGLLALPLLRARAQWGKGDHDGAYATLAAAAERFPEEPGPRLELVALCTEQGLHAMAGQWAAPLVSGADRRTALALMTALLPGRANRSTVERLAARFPDDPEFRARLAVAYARTGRWHAAGTLFAEATVLGGNYAEHAADQFRLAGDTRRALELNARVPERAARDRQRLHILFSGQEYARAAEFGNRLVANGTATPADRYRIAYAHFLLGQHARASALARELLGTDQASRARSLLGAMGRDPTVP